MTKYYFMVISERTHGFESQNRDDHDDWWLNKDDSSVLWTLVRGVYTYLAAVFPAGNTVYMCGLREWTGISSPISFMSPRGANIIKTRFTRALLVYSVCLASCPSRMLAGFLSHSSQWTHRRDGHISIVAVAVAVAVLSCRAQTTRIQTNWP